jgi:hypothetical protein
MSRHRRRHQFQLPPTPVVPGGNSTVVFFTGQSLADGWSTDPQNTTALTKGYGYEYYASTTTNGVILPLGRNRMGRTQGGPHAAFCQTGAGGGLGPVIAVDCASSGASMAVSAPGATLTGTSFLPEIAGGTFDQSSGANIYTNYFKPLMTDSLAKIAAAGFTIGKQMMYWSQGQQDAAGNVSQATYEAAFRAFLTQLKADFPSIVVVIDAIGGNQAGYSTAHQNINAAQLAVAADPAYSAWVKIGCDIAKTFTSGDFSDTLHYNQTRCNEIGAAMATAAITALGSPGYAVPNATKIDQVNANLPTIPGWKKIEIDTARSGSWEIQFYSDPAAPYAVTWFDGAGENMARTDQATIFTYGSSAAKTVTGYVSDTIGGGAALVGTGTTAATAMRFPNAGIKINTINFGTPGSMADGCTILEADILRLDSATLASLGLSGVGAAERSNITITNAMLSAFPNLTSVGATRSQTPSLTPSLRPALKNYTLSQTGMSVAQVNQFLIDNDALGLSSGSINVAQYRLSPAIAAAAPTGAGATAKTNLIGRSYSVTTD